MVTNKIKALLALKGFSFADYARALGITPQSLQTKSKKDAYKIKDLIRLAELTGSQVSITDKETGKILVSFDPEDIQN